MFTIINIYACNNIVPKYMKQNLPEVNRDIMVGDINTSLLVMYRIIRQEIIKEIEEVNNTIN